jgi:DNA-binding NarL/FixJ family response regulator
MERSRERLVNALSEQPAVAPPLRIAIVDDHPLVREGLAARIATQPDLQVCCEAADPDSALELIRTRRPDLAIVDVGLKQGSGLDLVKAITAEGNGPKMLVVSAYDEELFAERMLRAGAHGYVNKQELHGSVLEAIRAVLAGEIYLSSGLAQRLASQAVSGRRGTQGLELLSDRELQIFELIGRGSGTRAIAAQLHLSVHTVESHREHIRAKLNLRNGTELLRRAVLWTLESRA